MKPPKSHLSESRTPGSEAARRSLRLASSPRTPASKHKRSSEDDFEKIGCVKKSRRSLLGKTPSKRVYIVPATLNPPESKKKRQSVSLQENKPGKKRCTSSHVNRPATKHSASLRENKPCSKRSYYKKVIFCGWQFKVDDDVYVRRREDAESDDDDPVEEECMICFETGGSLMLECDDCLCGFHLQCLRPPLQKVPEGDWICEFCEAKKIGKPLNLPTPPEGKKRQRTAREKLLSGDLWAARIESLWKEPNGTFWLKCRWYIIPEETSVGRQPHNLRRELYRTNHVSDIEMESIFRHCYVMEPREFGEANNEGDDVFYCEYEYDVCWHSFKRLAEVAEPNEGAGNDKDWKYPNASGSESEEDSDFDDTMGKLSSRDIPAHELAANSRKGRIFGLHKIGLKKIPEHVRLRKTTALERAKSMLLHADLPKTLPCRVKEMEDITAFIKGTICKDYCLGRCLYIHGVPGTGKTMTVHTVLRNLRTEVDTGKMRPYCFVEVNGLKLASPEYIYKVIYEALSGQRVGWKKALSILNERFSEGTKIGKEANQPCILLVDELDLLLTRNQSVLYNLFDWPTKPDSKLIVIGIANTMDLPEKFLPRISSRMGIQRLCFGPYQYQQLKEIISSRLKGIDVFDEQAIEFASRKVAAMSGDARRALEICRRAADVADYRLKQLSPSLESSHEENHLVGMDDIEAAIREVFQAPHIQIIKTASRLSKIMLAAMIHELYRSGLSEVTFQKLATTICSMCINNRETQPGLDTLLRICCKLGECRIIISEEGAKNRLQKLQLNFPSEDVSFALKDCLEIPWLAKYL